MSTSIESLIPELQEPCRALVDIAGAAGVQPRITSTLRTYSQQAHLYRSFLNGRAGYPVAPPGKSAHEFGYAFDLVVVGTENQNDLGQVWESWGGKWGGRAHDPIHFEYPGFQVPEPPLTAQVGIGLATPLPVSAGVTLAQAAAEHPQLAEAINLAIGMGLPVTPFWNWELSLLPSWLRQSLSLF
jgi:D-alanyl-D-alanine carboxypeptidase